MSIFKEHNPNTSRKLVRELARLQRDLWSTAYRIKFWWVQRRYDAQWPNQLLVTEGTQSATDKFAVLVLYQPEGLRRSTLETCAYLKACGYAMLAMANAPFSEEDRRTLAEHVYKLCERPNYGYDAGAYRDGVWMLRHDGLKPESVILLNDSLLFPLQHNSDMIVRIESSNDTLGGLVRKTKFKSDQKAGQETSGFIEAYFYHVNLRDETTRGLWQRFWDTLALTTGRAYLKEARLSEFFNRAGQPLNTLASRHSFLAAVAELDETELRKVLHYGAYSVPELAEAGKKLLAAAPHDTWRDAALAHITETVSRYPFYGSFVYGSETLMRLGFLKRTNTPLFCETRKAYLRAVEAGDLPAPSDTVISELKALVALHENS